MTTRVCREPGVDACVQPATRLVVVGGDAALRDITLTTRVCREPGADACVQPASRLVVVGGDAALRDITLTTCVCREPGADACFQSATRLVVVGGPARTCLVLRPHAARTRRQQVLARHGRKYDTDLTAVSMRFTILGSRHKQRHFSRHAAMGNS